MTWDVLHGDCIEVMATLPSGSVDAVITSPPYAQQRRATYGGVPESEYAAWTVAWMQQARRLLTPNGSVVINLRPHVRDGQISDYALRTRLALREAGWAEVEELIWHKKGGAPVGHVGRPRRSWESLHWFAQHGRPFCDPKAAGRLTSRFGGLGGRRGVHIHGPQAELKAGHARVSDVADISVRKNENDGDLNRPARPRRVDRQARLPSGRHDPRPIQRVRLDRHSRTTKRLRLHRRRHCRRVRRGQSAATKPHPCRVALGCDRMRASMWTERRNDTTGRFVIAKTNGGSFRPVGQRNDGVMVLLRGLAAFITTIPWPTLRRCQHKWSPRTYPWACQRCGAPRRP